MALVRAVRRGGRSVLVGHGRVAVRYGGGPGAAGGAGVRLPAGRLRHVKLARSVGWDRAARAVGCRGTCAHWNEF